MLLVDRLLCSIICSLRWRNDYDWDIRMIDLQSVGVKYPDGTEALRDIDLHIERDEFAFITGPSGAGKSTLLGLVYRDIVPTAGKVVVDGQDVAKLRPGRVPFLRRKVGVVFQEFQLLPRKTIWENVGFALDVVGASRREKYHKVPISLELVGLTEKADAFPYQLSAGQRQRVSIARALVNGPPILLADEPTGNLDPDTSWEIVQLLLNINQQNTTVVVATHDREIVDRTNCRIVQLLQGYIVRDAKEGGKYDAP